MKIAVVGAGIGGLTAAVALEQRGFDVEVFEQADAFSSVGAGISIAANAMRMFRTLGLDQGVAHKGRVLERAIIQSASGATLSSVDLVKAGNGAPSIGIHRARLHSVLIDGYGAGAVHLRNRITDLFDAGSGVVLRTNDAEMTFDLVVVADGLHSTLRDRLLSPEPVRDTGQICFRGIATGVRFDDEVPDKAGVEIWGPGSRFGHVSIGEGEIYWYATANEDVMPRAERETWRFRSWFKARFPTKVAMLLEHTPDDVITLLPLADRAPVSEWYRGRCVLLGDAIHPTTPNLGQGACMAIESACILARCIAEEPGNHGAAFARYSAIRQPRTRMITERSRRIGKVAQTASARVAWLRNLLVRAVPGRLQESALRQMLEM